MVELEMAYPRLPRNDSDVQLIENEAEVAIIVPREVVDVGRTPEILFVVGNYYSRLRGTLDWDIFLTDIVVSYGFM